MPNASFEQTLADALAKNELEPNSGRRQGLEAAVAAAGGKPAAIPALLALARLDAKEGNGGEALARLNGALQRHPGHASPLLKIAFLLREEPNLDDPGAQDLLQTPDALPRLFVPAPPPESADGLPLHRTARAIRAADAAVQCRRDWSGAVGWLCAEFLRTPEAKLNAAAPKLLGRMASALDACALCPEAAELALYGVRRFPADMPLRCVAARMACQARRWEEVDQALEPVLKAAPWNRVARGYQALSLLGRGRLDEGWALLKEWGMQHTPEYMAEVSLALAPFDPRLANERPAEEPAIPDPPAPGGVLAKAVAKAEAALSSEAAMFAPAPKRRAIFEESLATLDAPPAGPAAEELAGDQTQWHLMRGYALLHLDRCAEARRHFAAALHAAPTEALLASGHGEAALFSGDPATAVESYLQVVPEGPNDFGAYFHLGLAYAKLGRDAEARQSLRAAFTRHFDDSFLVSLSQMRAAIHDARAAEAADGAA